MTKHRIKQTPLELILIPLLFTLSGICFTLMILTPLGWPPIYYLFNILWGTAGTILFAVGIWLTYRLHLCIHALSFNEKPDYHHANRTFLIIILILTLILTMIIISNLYMIGSPIPPLPPPQ